jgi:DNA processing protein
MVEERAYWAAWSQIPGIGAVLLKRLQQHFQSLAGAWVASERELAAIEGLGSKSITAVCQARSQLSPQQLLEQQCQKDPNFWTPADPEYPRLLWETPAPPPLLYYRGQPELSENQGHTPLVGIVGTRYPTQHGRRWTRKISIALVKQGFAVVSGMATGIDGEAHRSCLEAGGRTLAVLGNGIDLVYPSNHRQLYGQIQEQGLILSEYPVGTPPDRGNFPARNRIIAGLSRAVLVMEAPEKSGALITARYATEYGRDVFTLPNSPDVQEARGCLKLIHQGAEIIVHIEELLEMLGAIPSLDGSQPRPNQERGRASASPPTAAAKPMPALAPDLAVVLQVIPDAPTPFDAIVREAGLSAGEVSAALLQLELLELVSQLPGMQYRRTK